MLSAEELAIIFGLLIMIVTHAIVARYWVASLISGGICSAANIIHEASLNDFSIRPADAVYWIPTMLVMSIAFLLPLSYLIGLPFFLFRRRKERKADSSTRQ